MMKTNKSRITEDQRTVYEAVMNFIAEGNSGILFFDSPGGNLKNFLINLILAEIRFKCQIDLAVASPGIASTLLDGGRTQLALQLPLNIAETKRYLNAALLRTCKLFVWDECTMSTKKSFEAPDGTVCDLRNDNRIMGGVLILLLGDFRQNLPVISGATPEDELNACLKSLSKKSLVIRPKENLNQCAYPFENFSKQLLSLGDAKFPTESASDLDSIPSDFCVSVPSLKELMRDVFSDISNKYKDHHWLRERGSLDPKNENVNKTNEIILKKLPGNSVTYKFVDSVMYKLQAKLQTHYFS
ncbi:hypothetical protein AVEN_110275-1 [Araneus ventricosus]|uniref:ATP-dependent DNA helicase n=1 Tax=Araneus ventricosus TaxID=182803 RepID=A0A4Y2DP37_ARAVE|nr:hypothetical protein AVEN_110275-1 [Araneus ventricosus]